MSEFKRHNFKKLKIWLMSMELSKIILDLTDTFPVSEKYGLKSQMDRCCISMPSNIAEGSSRTDKSFSHFLNISLGTSFELQTQLILIKELEILKEEKALELINDTIEIQKMIYSFKNTLNK